MSVSITGSTHPNGHERHAEAGTVTPRTDRDGKGRFVKGNAGGPGNPFNRQVAALRQQLVDALTPERMGRIIEAVAQKAEARDLAAAKLLWQYGMGKPAPTAQPDRLDLEELALYQEQELSAEAWVQILKNIPAGMACQMLRPIMPILNHRAAKGIQQLAHASGIGVSKRAPSVTEHNGEEAPVETGDNGERKRTANGGNGRGGDEAMGSPEAYSLACPRKRGHGTAQAESGSGMALSQAAPSVTEVNGEDAPTETGDNGEPERSPNRGNGDGGRSHGERRVGAM